MSAERLPQNPALAASATAERIRNTIQANSEVSPVRSDAGHVIGYTLDASVPAAMLAAEMVFPAPAAESAERLAERREIYELKTSFSDWTEVSKAEWIRAERGAGFRPKMASTDPRWSDTCATGGFSSGVVQGRIRYEGARTVHLVPAASGSAELVQLLRPYFEAVEREVHGHSPRSSIWASRLTPVSHDHHERTRAVLASGGAAAHCDLGVGCDEYGVCFAEAHGEPDRCGRTRGGAAADLARVEAENVMLNANCKAWRDHATAADLRARAAEAALTEAKAAAEGMRVALKDAYAALEPMERAIKDDGEDTAIDRSVLNLVACTDARDVRWRINRLLADLAAARERLSPALSTTPSVSGEADPAVQISQGEG